MMSSSLIPGFRRRVQAGCMIWPTMAVKIVTMGMQAVWGFLLCRYVIFK
jgi:hypothetical protein